MLLWFPDRNDPELERLAGIIAELRQEKFMREVFQHPPQMMRETPAQRLAREKANGEAYQAFMNETLRMIQTPCEIHAVGVSAGVADGECIQAVTDDEWHAETKRKLDAIWDGVDFTEALARREEKLAMSNHDLPAPRFTHDCANCTYLGQYEAFDLYFCTQGGTRPTVIARFGDDGPEYHSGIYAEVRRVHPELEEAYNRAKQRGMVAG